MNDSDPRPEPPDLNMFIENRQKFPSDQLLEYAGLHIAWDLDGTRILTSGQDIDEVEKNLIAGGYNPSRVVFDFVPLPDVSYF